MRLRCIFWMTVLSAAAALHAPASRGDTPPLNEFASWSLRPDGEAAVYIVAAGGGQARLLHQKLRSGVIEELPAKIPAGTRLLDIRPTWSPDGARLAYFLPFSGAWRLHVWSSAERSVRTFEKREACVSVNTVGCKFGQIAWSPDSRRVYFLAQPSSLISQREAAPAWERTQRPTPQWRRVLFADPENGGVTVLESKPAPADEALGPGFAPSGVPSDVVYADVHSGTSTVALAGQSVTTLVIAPDGRQILAIASAGYDRQVRQSYSDFFVLPVGADGVVPGQHEPVLRRVRQVAGPAAWSPDSTRIAFAENGAATEGDLFVLHVGSGEVKNVTAAVPIAEPGEVREEMPASVRHNLTPGSKFGDATAIVWSPDGNAFYASRRTRMSDGWRTRLWRISLSGAAVNLSAGESFDAGLPQFTGRDGIAIVPVQRLVGEIGFAEHVQGRDPLRLIRSVPGKLSVQWTAPVSFSRKGEALFVSESATEPPEAFVFRRRSGAIRRVTDVNAAARRGPLPGVHRIDWDAPDATAGPDGRARSGLLYAMPHSVRPPALIVQIYPREPQDTTGSSPSYARRADTFLPPLGELLHAGYAVFKPMLPVAGNGRTCDDVAANLERALDAIELTKLADTRRAALIGMSFGGWTVNCVIARTSRFKAAVSVAGGADLFSTAFSPVESAASWGIGGGQMRIGKTVWAAPDLYWRESPVSGAEQVTTPLLLIHGKLDNSVPVAQAAEMYTALSRLGKEVTLVTYDDADHGSVIDHPDYATRVRRWIVEHAGAD